MLSTNRFHYDKETNTFTADASDLQFPYFNWPKQILLQSAKTGKVITCVAMYDTGSGDPDNELLYRTYKPLPRDGVMFRVEVFND